MSTSRTYPAHTGTVTVLVMTALFVLTQLYLAIVLLAPISKAFGTNVTFALTTAFSLCYALGFLIWGPIADHYGRKKILILGLSLLVLATTSCAFAHSSGALLAARSIQGFTAASFAPIALAYLSEATKPQHRATAIGAMSTAFLVAGIFGQVIAQAVSQHFGWPWMFGISAIILTICLIGITMLMRETTKTAQTDSLTQQFTTAVRLLTQKRIVTLCAAHITLLLSFVAMYSALGPHLTTLGSSTSTVLSLRLVGLPGMFMALLVGPLSRRFSMIALARAGFLISMIGLLLLACATKTMIGIGLTSLVFVAGVAIAVPTMITLFGQTAAPHRATGMAINGTVLFLGASIGPLLATFRLSFPALVVLLALTQGFAALCLSISARTSSMKTGR